MEVKMNNYQITLFFAKDTIFKIIELSNSLFENIANLGDPILLPNNQAGPKEANFPLIIFNQNREIQITANFQSIIISIEKNENINIEELMLKINSILIENEINVVRIGYGYKIEMDKQKADFFKNKNFVYDEIKNSINFELSWLTEIIINNLKVNCWQRYFTSQQSENLNIIFDINTKAEEENEISNEFLKQFITEAEEFIKNKLQN